MKDRTMRRLTPFVSCLLVLAFCGSAFLSCSSADAGLLEHWKLRRKSRKPSWPLISPGKHPTYGYYATRWRRFPGHEENGDYHRLDATTEIRSGTTTAVELPTPHTVELPVMILDPTPGGARSAPGAADVWDMPPVPGNPAPVRRPVREATAPPEIELPEPPTPPKAAELQSVPASVRPTGFLPAAGSLTVRRTTVTRVAPGRAGQASKTARQALPTIRPRKPADAQSDTVGGEM